MAFETDCRAVYRNLAEDVVSNCYCFMVSGCVLPLVLRCFFSTLAGALASVLLRGTADYGLMEFTVLSLLTISSNTGSFSES